MFLRILHGLSIFLLVASAFAVYKVKYESTYEVQRIAKLRSEVVQEREKVALLRAEWTRLASPERIQDLASRHLGLKPIEVARIRDLSDLPEKPAAEEEADPIGEFIATLGGAADEPRDPLGDFLRAINSRKNAADIQSGAEGMR